MKQLSGVRKAYPRFGDDGSYTRWIRTTRHHLHEPFKTIPMAATATGTRYPTRVLKVAQQKALLVTGHNNVKIGRDVRIGKLKGYWLYTLSLEERATCPTSCGHWRDCYGNNMPFAKRIDHRDPLFLPTLEQEVAKRLGVRNRPGIIVRLHALGDFYSVEYVEFWGKLLTMFPKLVIFGYTARDPADEIGAAVNRLIDTFPGRAMMRFSGGSTATRCAVSIPTVDDCPPGAFVCPDQTGQFDGCGKCGACWSTLKNVGFADH